MHTCKDGGIDSQKVVELMNNWTFQSPLTPRNEGDKDDIEMGSLKDITAKELKAEFDLLQLRLSGNPSQDTTQQVRPIPGGDPPPTVRVHALSRPSLWLFVPFPDLLSSPTSIVRARTRTHDLGFHGLLGLLGPRPSIYWFSG
jgi:hypothetical protein